MVILANKKALKYISLVSAVLFTLGISFILVLSSATNVFDETRGGQISQDGIAVPIIMYHSIMKKSPEMGKYVITPAEFEGDIRYLKNHDYNSVNIQDLIDYVYNGLLLPPKPVVITFDDGNLNNYTYGKPILQKYGMKAVISVVGAYTESFSKSQPPTSDPDYAFISWDQLREISESGYFEIQNHTYNLHFINKSRYGIKRKSGESPDSYRNMLTADILKLQNKIQEVTGAAPNTFTYPFGYSSSEAKAILKELGFKATLSCVEGVNLISRNRADVLYDLKRKNRPHGISPEYFFKNFCP